MSQQSLHTRSESLTLGLIFIFCFISRVFFKWASGFDNFQLFGDAQRYDALSDKILAGAANMDVVAYLTAPLYPYTLALAKWLSADHWEVIAVSYQFVLVGLSAVASYKLGQLLWKDNRAALIGCLFYICYPMTCWYNFTLAQETSFQAYFLYFLYFFIKNLSNKKQATTLLAGLFFTFALLTKSHIILLLPLLLLLLAYKVSITKAISFLAVILVMTLPHGFKNYKQHGVYTLSSQGNASLFLLGHNDITYDCIFDQHKTKETIACDPSFVFDKDYIYAKYGKANGLAPRERNKLRWRIALDWIQDHPMKVLALKWFGFKRFILPGLDKNQYPFIFWFVSLLIGLSIYIPGYLALAGAYRSAPSQHLIMLSLIALCLVIFIGFLPVNRFRVVTMEPLLCVYAGQWYMQLWRKLLTRTKTST